MIEFLYVGLSFDVTNLNTVLNTSPFDVISFKFKAVLGLEKTSSI